MVFALYPQELTSEIARLLDRRESSVYGRAKQFGLKKDPAFFESDASGRLRKGMAFRRVTTRFKPGNVPWSKGVKGLHLSPATQFKKGQRGTKWMPIGSLRINADGYLDRKVCDTGYPPDDWKAVHRLVWIEANGPIPEGHLVAFLPGRRTTEVEKITVDALELVSRVDWMKRHTYHQYGKEIAQLVQLRGAITRQINKRGERA